MTEAGPPKGYRRVYKNKGYVASDGTVHRKFKDKQVTTRWMMVVGIVIVITYSVWRPAGDVLLAILAWSILGVLMLAMVLRFLEILIGQQGIDKVGEWRDRQIQRKAIRREQERGRGASDLP